MRGRLFVIAALPLSGWSLFAQLGRTAPPGAAAPLVRNQAAVEAGQRQFLQLCTGCHGRNGEGGQGEGQGPNLVNSWEVRRASDQQLMASIRKGIKGTAMPAFPLSNEQITQLAAFVRSLNAPANSVPAPGDAAAGERIFYGKGGCGGCHMIRGRGGYLGPDLSNAGVTHRLGELRDAILKPSALSSDGYRPVLLPGGLRAVVKHYSNWSMQVLDEKGQIHLLRGADMKTAAPRKTPWMPADYAQRLSAEEIQNLVAFLSHQAVRPDSEPEQAPPRRAAPVDMARKNAGMEQMH